MPDTGDCQQRYCTHDAVSVADAVDDLLAPDVKSLMRSRKMGSSNGKIEGGGSAAEQDMPRWPRKAGIVLARSSGGIVIAGQCRVCADRATYIHDSQSSIVVAVLLQYSTFASRVEKIENNRSDVSDGNTETEQMKLNHNLSFNGNPFFMTKIHISVIMSHQKRHQRSRRNELASYYEDIKCYDGGEMRRYGRVNVCTNGMRKYIMLEI